MNFNFLFKLSKVCLLIVHECVLYSAFFVVMFVWCDTDIKMLPALLSIEPEKVYALPDHSLADDDFKLMATLSDLADRELVATIGWAKQVPGKPVCLERFKN